MIRPCLFTLLCAVAWPALVHASDRPYLLTSSAAAEEDDDETWSVETWWQRSGGQQAFVVAPEYAFNPTTSVQFQFSRASGNRNALEVEFKHLFNHIGRQGWGWGVDLSVEAAGQGQRRWRGDSAALKLPYTLQLAGGDALLHLNAGIRKERGERHEWVGSAAFEHKLPGRNTAFLEAGREQRQTLRHAGVRHWIRREKLALDVSVQRLRGVDGKTTGGVLGLAWYDL